jgi:hypothetical protein
MRKCVFVLLLLPTLACSMWKKPASGWKGATGGEQLETLFWKDVQAKNWAEIDRRVAATFLGAGPGGVLDRAAFLRDLQENGRGGGSLSDCATELNGADLAVACIVRRNGAGGPGATATVSVWQQLSKGWVMVTHAESPVAGR